mmetsp:Transcript_16761/g.23472  ORF Transcript_16761/g.23472 Transcript_16761/m.23472 type:complete len:420 (+) Transcript_16761:144-1403(+)
MSERVESYGSFPDDPAAFAPGSSTTGDSTTPFEIKTQVIPSLETKQVSELEKVLKRINLGAYTKAFERMGFTDVDQLQSIEEWDIARYIGETVGMKPDEILHFYFNISEYVPGEGDEVVDLLPESMRDREARWPACRCCKMIRFYCGGMCSPLDFIVPPFLRGSFRQVVLRAHSGEDIKDIYTQIMARRRIVFSFLLGGIMACWNLFPDERDLPEFAIVLWECTMVLAATAALSVVMLSGTFETQLALVDSVNAKAFIVTISEGFAFSQGMMIVSVLSFFFGIGYVGFYRVYQRAKGSEPYGYTICAYVGVLVVFCVICLNYTYIIVLRGGLMEGKKVGNALRTASATFEDRAREEDFLQDAVITQAINKDHGNESREIISQGTSPRGSGPPTHSGWRARRRRSLFKHVRQVRSMDAFY